MATYTVLTKGSDTVSIRNGFNVWGLLFGPLWSMFHGLWTPTLAGGAALLFLGSFAKSAAASGIEEGAVVAHALQALVGVAIGAGGNKWHARKLKKKGYEEIATSSVETLPPILN